MLRQQLGGGSFGSGIAAPQQQAMQSVNQFISARETPEQFMALMGPLREMFQLNSDKAAAQTREGQSIAGTRLSRSTASAEGATRNEGMLGLESLMSQLFLQDQGNLLNAIGQKQGMAQQNVDPFLQFGSAGIMPDQTMINDSTGMQLFKGLGELLKIGASAAGSLRGGG